MVDMGMGDEDIINGVGRKGEFRIGDLVPALLQAAVHQDALAVHFQAMAAACDALIRAVKIKLHQMTSSI